MSETTEPDTAEGDTPPPLGRRAVRVQPGPGRIVLAEGLTLGWKAQDIPAGDGGVTARPARTDGIATLALDLPKGLGWVRLTVDLPPPPPPPEVGTNPALLACRLLVHLPDAARHALRPALTCPARPGGRADPVEASEVVLSLGGGWHAIEGLMLCHPAGDRPAGLILRLPEAARLTLGPVETAWFAADLASDALSDGVERDGAVPVRPFAARPLAAADLPTALAAPLAADVTRRGLEAAGWALASPPLAARSGTVTLEGGNRRHSLPLTEMAEIAPGLRVQAGFVASVLPFLDAAAQTPGLLTVRFGPGRSGPVLATLALPPALSALARPRPPAPRAEARICLFHTPADPGPDPYRTLLYRAMPQAEARPGDLESAVLRAEAQVAAGMDGPVALHVYALPPLVAAAEDVAGARALARAWTDRLAYFVHLGGVVLWTVEGPLPDETPLGRVLHGLGQAIADHASAVHVHGAAAAVRVQACWRIPAARLVVAAHPGYPGHYPDYVSRDGARARLGLTEPDPAAPGAAGPVPVKGPVFLLQGRLAPDKGIDDLVAAFVRLREDMPEAWLVIMGEPAPPLRKGLLTRSYGSLPHVRVIETRAAETTLQWYYRAADWAVLPYRDVITPKALLCATAFGLPVVAPRLPAVAEFVQPSVTGLMYPQAPEGADPVPPLAAALARAARLSPEEARAMGAAARAAQDRGAATGLATRLVAAIDTAWSASTVTLAFDDGPRTAQLAGLPFPPKTPARTAVVILNYRHAEDTRRLIGALRAGTDTDFDVYVVDNCSPNLTLPDLAARFGDVHLLRLPENLGYAAGNNAALRLIGDLPYAFVWILNPDMLVPPAALAQHVEAAAAHPDTDIFGPVLLRGDDARRIASAGCTLSLDGGLSASHLYPGEQTSVLPRAPYEADFITGAALFLRRRVLDRIGLMPEEYFLYFEETAWLAAARAKGHAALVLPHIHLAHHKRSEDGDLPAPYFFFYYIRNALILAARLGGDGAATRTLARLRSDFIATWLQRISAARPDRLVQYRALADRAVADGLAGRTGAVDLRAAGAAETSDSPDAQPRPEPTPAERASLAVQVDAGSLLVGRIALADRTARGGCRIGIDLDGRLLGTVQTRAVEPPLPFEAGSVEGGTVEEGSVEAGALHQFQLPLPDGPGDGAAHRLTFTVNGHPLGRSLPLFLPRPAPAPAGAITGLDTHVCSGWLRDETDPDTPQMAEIVHEGTVVGRGLADRPGGPEQAGACGFAIRLPRALADGGLHALELRLAGSARPLATARLADAAFPDSRRQALLAPAAEVLAEMAYTPELWFGAQDPATLPVGRQMQAACHVLARQHGPQAQGALVSIILPVHNRAAQALRAIGSVRAQGHGLWELIVIDDASTDGTPAVIEAALQAAPDSRIRLIRRPVNGGAAAARNTGLDQAHGAFIAYLDSDDIWDPAYLETMVGALIAHPGVMAAASGHWLAQADPGNPDGAPQIIGLRLPPVQLAQIENRDLIALSGYVHRAGRRAAPAAFDPALRRHAGWGLILRHSAAGLPLGVSAPMVTCRIDGPDRLSLTEPVGPARARLAVTGLPAAVAAAALRPVDVVLRAPHAQDAYDLRRRIVALSLTLAPGGGHRIIVQTGAEVIAALADLAHPDLRLQPAQDSLAGALALRRPSADLVVIEPDTLMQAGWHEALSRALRRVPQAGMLVTRHSLPGRSALVRRHAPWADPAREACITVSASLRNLAGPPLDRTEGLLPLTGFAPVCTCIPADVIRLLPPPENGDHAAQMALWADLVRLHLGRPLVYCPRAVAITERA